MDTELPRALSTSLMARNLRLPSLGTVKASVASDNSSDTTLKFNAESMRVMAERGSFSFEVAVGEKSYRLDYILGSSGVDLVQTVLAKKKRRRFELEGRHGKIR